MNYRQEVMKNCPGFLTESIEQKLSLGGLGCAGEAGEVADLIKKILHHDQPLVTVRERLINEIGDVFWYLEYLCATLAISSEALIAESFVAPRENDTIYKKLSFASLGIAARGGAVAEYVFVTLHYDAPLSDIQDNLVKEMSDLKWFLNYLIGAIGSSVEEVLTANVEKLNRRHPNGWSKESQRAKADEYPTYESVKKLVGRIVRLDNGAIRQIALNPVE